MNTVDAGVTTSIGVLFWSSEERKHWGAEAHRILGWKWSQEESLGVLFEYSSSE